MVDIIKLLPDNVANQIAAGEVVQRPASVVKELLENSIDAEASNIKLIIKEAGRNLIQVSDNGKGMSFTDSRLSFERHATSKIKTTDDIFHINTKGFRGEALASIAAVAQVELKSKKTDEELGTQVIIEGGNLVFHDHTSSNDGSSISVKNLFYNVPARRKFLKSNSVEFRHIMDEFHRVALAHEDISFQLFNNDDEIFRLRSGNLLQRISDIFGRKIQSILIPISEEFDWLKVSGFVGKPECAKKNRNEQFFFVNHRFFKSNYFNKAVQDAFDNLIPFKYYPSFFLYIEIDPEKIDVNIHPTKTEVKFEDEVSIYALLRSSIKKSLGIYNVVSSLDFEQDPEWSFLSVTDDSNEVIKEPKIVVNPNFNPFEFNGTRPTLKEKISLTELYSSSINNIQDVSPEIFDFPMEIDKNMLRLSNGNWIYENNNELIEIDPYRVHQTVIFENFLRNSKKNILSQQLLFPLEKVISEVEKIELEAIKENLFKEGFDLEIQNDMLTILAIPCDIPQEKIFILIDNLLEQMNYYSNEEFSLFFNRTVSKVSAKKRNEFIQQSQLTPIIIEFEKLGSPKYNPFNKVNYTNYLLQEF